MVKVGEYNKLKVLRKVEFGVYLDDGDKGILLPTRFLPPGTKEGDTINAFVYHDGEDRLIATTQQPMGIVGDIVMLKAVSTTPQGAFLDWGLMKDLFVPKSAQLQKMIPNGHYLVKIVIDEQTGRIAASEKIDKYLSNDVLSVKEMDEVNLTVYRRTEIGYVMIINNKHTGILHFSDIFRNISTGDTFKGYIKKIYPQKNNIDLAAGKPGYQRVEDEAEKIIRLLQDNNGFLPFNDKSNPDDIYEQFAMSKKTFKMTIGGLFKKRIILIEDSGIKLIP